MWEWRYFTAANGSTSHALSMAIPARSSFFGKSPNRLNRSTRNIVQDSAMIKFFVKCNDILSVTNLPISSHSGQYRFHRLWTGSTCHWSPHGSSSLWCSSLSGIQYHWSEYPLRGSGPWLLLWWWGNKCDDLVRAALNRHFCSRLWHFYHKDEREWWKKNNFSFDSEVLHRIENEENKLPFMWFFCLSKAGWLGPSLPAYMFYYVYCISSTFLVNGSFFIFQ